MPAGDKCSLLLAESLLRRKTTLEPTFGFCDIRLCETLCASRVISIRAQIV
jgi:hypothetical protein